MKDDIFLINVQIGGFKMPLRIPRSDEAIYRDAEKMVVNYMETFQKKYNQRAYNDILTLVAFQLAVMLTKQEITQDISPLADRIKQLDEELEQLLNKE
jgi:hypothetical protein